MNGLIIKKLLPVLTVFIIILVNFNNRNLITISKYNKEDVNYIGIKTDSINNYPKAWPWKGVTLSTHYYLNVDKDLRRIKKAGANFVTIYLKPRKIVDFEKIPPKEAFEKALDLTDEILDKCKELNLYAMVYFSELPIDPSKKITQSDRMFWESEQERNQALSLIKTVVKRFATRGDELQAYQFFGEPVVRIGNGKSKRPEEWKDLFIKIYQIIKMNDKKRFIVYAPGPWGIPKAFKNLKPIINDDKIIYSFHYYLPHSYSHQGIRKYKNKYEYPGMVNFQYWDKSKIELTLKNVIAFQKKYKKLIYVGEFSANYTAKGWETYLVDLMSIFKINKFAYTYFTYNGYKAWAINNTNESSLGRVKMEKINLIDRKKRFNLLRNLWKN
jgi:hypothetical protein